MYTSPLNKSMCQTPNYYEPQTDTSLYVTRRNFTRSTVVSVAWRLSRSIFRIDVIHDITNNYTRYASIIEFVADAILPR